MGNGLEGYIPPKKATRQTFDCEGDYDRFRSENQTLTSKFSQQNRIVAGISAVCVNKTGIREDHSSMLNRKWNIKCVCYPEEIPT